MFELLEMKAIKTVKITKHYGSTTKEDWQIDMELLKSVKKQAQSYEDCLVYEEDIEYIILALIHLGYCVPDPPEEG